MQNCWSVKHQWRQFTCHSFFVQFILNCRRRCCWSAHFWWQKNACWTFIVLLFLFIPSSFFIMNIHLNVIYIFNLCVFFWPLPLLIILFFLSHKLPYVSDSTHINLSFLNCKRKQTNKSLEIFGRTLILKSGFKKWNVFFMISHS